MRNFEFNWSRFTEADYDKAMKIWESNSFNDDFLGAVNVGDICIELVNDCYITDTDDVRQLMYNFYVAHEDTGYGYKNEYAYDYLAENDGMPYDYADGDAMNIPYGVNYEKFKRMAEEKFTRYIVGCDNYFSYSLVEHASRPLEIW